MGLLLPVSHWQLEGGTDPIPIDKENLLFYLDANTYSGDGPWRDLVDPGDASYNFEGLNIPEFVPSDTNSYFNLAGGVSQAFQQMFLCQFGESVNMDSWSFCIWLYHTTEGDYTYQTVFDKDNDEELCYLYGSLNPEMEMWDPIISSGHNIESNTWLNLCWVYEEDSGPGNNGICRFYENGVRVPNPDAQFSHNDSSSPATQFTIGGGFNNGSENELMAGRVATAGLYSQRALGDEEILSNFNATKARFGYE